MAQKTHATTRITDEQADAYETLYNAIEGVGGQSPDTYEPHGGNEYKLTASNAFSDQRQHVSKTVHATEDGSYKLTVYNSSHDATLDEQRFDTLDEFLHWDINTSYTEYVQPFNSYTVTSGQTNRQENQLKALYGRSTVEEVKNYMLKDWDVVERLSAAIHHATARYADGHNPYTDEIPSSDELTFTLPSNEDARSTAQLALFLSPIHSEATVNEWEDTSEVILHRA